MFVIKYFSSFYLLFFFNQGKNKDEIIFLFPLCEGGLLKYLGINNTKIFYDESKTTFYLSVVIFYVFTNTGDT